MSRKLRSSYRLYVAERPGPEWLRPLPALIAGFLAILMAAPAPVSAAQPFAATEAAVWLDAGTVQFQGMAVPNGDAASAWFEWGTNSGFGTFTPAQSLGNGDGVVRVTHRLSGAVAQQPYWYRLVASNALGVVRGRAQIASAAKRVISWGENTYGPTNVPAGLSNIVEVAGGSAQGLALRENGTLVSWGWDPWGPASLPAGLSNVAAICCGYNFNGALCRDGTLGAWGDGSLGQTNPPSGNDYVAVSAGQYYGLALRANGQVASWGTGFYGEANVPAGLSNVVEISAGGNHALALRADGTLVAWGLNDYGQCAIPAGLSNAVSVAAGSGFSAALLRDGTVVAWGLNGSGQTTVPTSLSNVVAISCGGAHTLALTAGYGVVAWGHNVNGQTNVPPNTTNAVAVAAGDYFSLALTLNRAPMARSGTVAGFANLDLAIQLPVEDPDNEPILSRITALPPKGTLYQWSATGRGPAITTAGTAVIDTRNRVVYAPPPDALGTNYDRFGFMASDGISVTPEQTITIDLLRPVPHVATHPSAWNGRGNAVLSGMAVPNGAATLAWFEWGSASSYGASTLPADIGSGTSVVPVNANLSGLQAQHPYWCRLVASNRWGVVYGAPRVFCAAKNAWSWTYSVPGLAPTLAGLSNIVGAAAGGNHSLALRDDGTVVAWGDNLYGQTNVPAGLSGVRAVAAGLQFSAALKTNGTVVAWGENSVGQTNVPPGLDRVLLLAPGLHHTLALRNDGTVVAWGDNSYGETDVPAGLSNVVGVAAGSWHSLALKADGSVVGWGSNFGGETNPPNGLPSVQIGGGAGWSAALGNDGSVVTWGDPWSAQLPPGLTNMIKLSTAYFHGLALGNDLSLRVWGPGLTPLPAPNGWTNVVDAFAGPFRDVVLTVNREPWATGQHLWLYINQDLLIRLTGSDPDGDSISFRIAELPAQGTLYQYQDGARGAAITASGTFVIDPAGRVIFAPAPGTYGYDYTSFSFQATDGQLHSAAAVVSIDVRLPKPFVATQPAVWQDNTTAVFRGAVMPNGAPTTAWFEWGLTPELGNRTVGTNFPASIRQSSLNEPVTGLGPQVAYWCRLVASNVWGLRYGAPTLVCAAKSVVSWGGSYAQTGGLGGLSNIVFMAAGSDQVLAVKPDGNLLVFGNHNVVPATPPAGLSNVVSAAGGAWHSLALGRDGRVTAWGYDDSGQIDVPPDLSNVVAVAAGNFHNLALREDGSVVGWGYYGNNVPPELTNAVAVACGFGHCLALTCDGRPVAWGANTYGQTNVPTGLEDVIAIAARGDHCVALRSNGTVVVWGRSDYGQTDVPAFLGNGTVAIGSGGYQGMALTLDQKLAVWGYEYPGQASVLSALSNVVSVTGGSAVGLALALNRAPTASPAVATGWANRDLLLTLTGTDPERDLLSYGVQSLPARGSLYQYAAGVRGAHIVAPTAVSDPGGRLIFAPDPESFATNYASFEITAFDGQYESAPASITVNVIALPPAAATQPVTWLGPATPVLHGMVAAHGLTTTAWFEWGSDPSLGFLTAPTNSGTSPGVLYLSQSVGDVLGHRTYWYRLVASNLLGVAYGPTKIFGEGKRLLGWGGNAWGQTSVPFADDLVQVSAGAAHGLALKSDGSVLGWGNNYYGQTNAPVDLGPVVALAAGRWHSLALQMDGMVKAWGSPSYNQTSVPAELSNVIALAAGYYNSVALKADGTAVSWGELSPSAPIRLALASNLVAIAAGYDHTYGLGSDGRLVSLWNGNLPGIPTNLTDIIAIAAGDSHGAALRQNGTVVAWGDNFYGQTNVPAGLADVVAISAGGSHTLALKRNGEAVEWGGNVPGGVPAILTNATEVASGDDFDLAIVLNHQPVANAKVATGKPNQNLLINLDGRDIDGDVLTYRISSLPASGQIYQYNFTAPGEPITTVNTVLTNGPRVFFVPAPGEFGSPYAQFGFIVNDGETDSAEGLVRIDIDGRPSAATREAVVESRSSVTLNGSAIAGGLPALGWFEWGTNLALGQTTPPVALEPAFALQQMSAPVSGLVITGAHYCRLVVSNAAGTSLGGTKIFTTGSRAAEWGSYGSAPAFVAPGLGPVTAIAAGTTHSVALRLDGTVAAWGVGDYYSGTAKTNVPAGLSNVCAVAAGPYYSAALKRDGRIIVWGGSPGAGSLTNIPPGATNVIAIAVGTSHIVVLLTNGTVYGWTSLGLPPPVLSSIVAVAAGDNFGLALGCDGKVTGWGNGLAASVPPGMTDIEAVAAGGAHALALRKNGRVVGWGANTYGQANVPLWLTNAVAVAAGANHSLALTADGKVVGWGLGNYGQTNPAPALSNFTAIASGGNHNAALVANRAPAVPRVSILTQANHDRVIPLVGIDPDLDPLAFVITSIPGRGDLYQCADGARGALISQAGTLLQDTNNRVVFAPGLNETGDPYTSFEFAASDGELVSAVSAVRIAVAPLVTPQIESWSITAEGSFHLLFSGDLNTQYCVLASSDLVTWEPAGSAGQFQGKFVFVDASARNFSRRFYRVSTACLPSGPAPALNSR